MADAEHQRCDLAEIDLVLQVEAGLFQHLGRGRAQHGRGAGAIDRVVDVDRVDAADKGLLIRVLEVGIVDKNGRASCRERVCQYVEISVVAGSLKKKYKHTKKSD